MAARLNVPKDRRMTDPFPDFAASLRSRERQHRHRKLVPRLSDGRFLVEPDGTRLLNFGSNDYLGFAHRDVTGDPLGHGFGSGASSLVSGWTPQHQRLADRLAGMEASEAAVVFPSGYAAGCGVISTLARRGDLILSDELNHASLIDGCRLSRAETLVYSHRDVAHARRVLLESRVSHQRCWMVTESIFSMDGDVAPLAELCDLADEFDATMLVDEAHATGVFGDHGSGLCEALGLRDRVTIRMGTLSKAIGSQGGFVVGNQTVIDYLINHCRTLIYSTSLAPASVFAAITSVHRIQGDDRERRLVRDLATRFRTEFGVQCENDLARSVPIVPIIVGDDDRALRLSRDARRAGYFVPAIRPPTVPEGSSRLRVSLSAIHETADVVGLAKWLRSEIG